MNVCYVPFNKYSNTQIFGWGKGGNVTSWQVTLCDLIWHVSFRSGMWQVRLRTAIFTLDRELMEEIGLSHINLGIKQQT